MKDFGKMINKMDLELKNGQVVLIILENMLMGVKMDLEF